MKTLLSFLLFLPFFTAGQVIVTVAGTGTSGYNGDGIAATAAQLTRPYGVALDDSSNLYICDAFNRRVRKVNAYTHKITTIAGNGSAGYSGDGDLGIYAQISVVYYIAVDKHRNVYIADGHRVRKITPEDTITTIAGTGTGGYNGDGIPATTAQLWYPNGIAVDDTGNVYIIDRRNFRIRKVDTFGIISTIAGTGVPGYSPDGCKADTAKIDSLHSICIDNAGNLYFFDNVRIRKKNTADIITTIAGNGIVGYSGDGGMATSAMIDGGGLTIDASGSLYIADAGAHRIRKVTTDGIINTIAGTGAGGYNGDGGNPLLARLGLPHGVAVSSTGDVYIGDVVNDRIRMITYAVDHVAAIDKSEQGIAVYPNPAFTYIYIEGTHRDNRLFIYVTDVNGKIVYKGELQKGTTQTSVDVRDFVKGIYNVEIQDKEGVVFFDKIIIQ